MFKNLKSTKFYKNWVCFLSLFFSPWPLILLILSGISIWLSLQYKDNIQFSTLVSIIAALFAGLAGSFIKDEFGSLVLEKKGRSAVRNLSSINTQIGQVKDWIKLFISKKKITERDMEEVNRHLSTTEINIKSGLEDWVDIVPELRESTEVAKIYGDVVRGYVEEFLKNKKELLAAGENKELKEKLGKKMKELEKNIKELKKESPNMLSHPLGSTMITASGIGSVLTYSPNHRTCRICGKDYIDSLIISDNVCPDCKKNNPGMGIYNL